MRAVVTWGPGDGWVWRNLQWSRVSCQGAYLSKERRRERRKKWHWGELRTKQEPEFSFLLCLVIFMSMWCLLLFSIWTQFNHFWKKSYPSSLGKLLRVQRDTAVRGLHGPCHSMNDQYRVVVMLTESVEGRPQGARPGTVLWLEWDASESGWWSEMGWRDSNWWDRYWGGRMQRADDWRRAGVRETSIRNNF